MRRPIVIAASLSLGLAGFVGAVSAQDVPPEVIVTDASGTSAASNSALNPTASGEGTTIVYGDINTGGANRTVLEPPTVIQSGGAPPAAPAAEPAPAVDTTTTETAPADTAVATETDLDADNYPDAEEPALGLDPGLADTDGDGVADGDELNIYGTDPTIFDGDGDGASDGEEIFGSLTDPLVWDDFTVSGTETVAQQTVVAPQQLAPSGTALLAQTTTENLTATNGNVSALGTGNASSAPGTITRNGYTVPSVLGPDGTYSVSETSPPVITVGANLPVAPAPEPVVEPIAEPVAEPVAAEPVVADTAVASAEDLDADNYPDALEWELGLDGNNPDSDADGVADGDELNSYGTDPLVFDSDGDGLSDGEELFGLLTDPLVWDTDGDGVGDGL